MIHKLWYTLPPARRKKFQAEEKMSKEAMAAVGSELEDGEDLIRMPETRS